MNQRYKNSLKKWNESKKYLIPGSVTISKHPELYTLGAYPIYIDRGDGVVVEDIDGNKYIDFQSGLGAINLGLSYKRIDDAIKQQLKKGVLFPLSQTLQIDLAKLICSMVPSAERVRFLKNGSDATSAAIRIARAYTKRDKIISCHFHGWHDWFYIITPQNKGIPKSLKKDIIEFKYNDINSLKKIFEKNKGRIAAVIMEPAQLEVPEKGFLEEVKRITKKNGALLIFDEVVTGFRFSKGGAQEYFNVTPDLSCFAKALGNGLPISAVAGKRKIMESTSDVITSMTYGEECLSMAGAIEVLKEIKEKPVIKHIWDLGELFKEEYNKLAKKYGINTQCIGFPCRLELSFSDHKKLKRKELRSYFLQESSKRGILFGMHIFMTYSHKKSHIKKALNVCEEIFKKIKILEDNKKLPLEGDLPLELW
jgi:glutamate-1-semialdehyde aminotransferase